MIKYGCAALLAVACCTGMPVAHAQGNFFVAGQAGQAKYDDVESGDDTADTYALSGGYRWQAGPIVQVGVEGGGGVIDEVGSESVFTYLGSFGSDTYTEVLRTSLETRYLHIGGNARISFGEGSRWFALVRGGYMAYSQDVDYRYNLYVDQAFDNNPNSELIDTDEGSFEDDGGGAYFGAGIGMDITPNVNVNLMFNGYAYSSFEYEDNFDDEDVGTVRSTTLGLEVRF